MANNDWQEYQFIQGAVFNNETISSFGNIQNELLYTQHQNVICDLSHLALLEISGDDALSFLQGQVTNDVKLLGDSKAHYTGYCSPKGRLLALFFAFSQHQNIYLQLNSKLLEPISKRLKMYVMRAKVNIRNVSDNRVRIGLSGNDVADFLAPFFTQIPSLAYTLSHTEQGTLIRLPSKTPRFEIICDTDRAKEIWHALKKQCQPVGKSCWEWLEIQAGIPDIYLKTQEEFVPQMVNLDLLDAINFKKGCYTGQEIVARTHYLGKVKRRTQLMHINTSVPPQAANDVLNKNNEVIGKIVRSAAAPAGGYAVLAEVRLESVGAGDLFVNGIKVAIQQLPYPLQPSE
ncbi:MAG: folate-binding protein [Methylotenera sp.]|nr:folate-binding protein [Methylotenera sp.]MSP99217.1 folate-binding protein [Methylotenera sp.]